MTVDDIITKLEKEASSLAIYTPGPHTEEKDVVTREKTIWVKEPHGGKYKKASEMHHGRKAVGGAADPLTEERKRALKLQQQVSQDQGPMCVCVTCLCVHERGRNGRCVTSREREREVCMLQSPVR